MICESILVRTLELGRLSEINDFNLDMATSAWLIDFRHKVI